jgi:hypothetical protein
VAKAEAAATQLELSLIGQENQAEDQGEEITGYVMMALQGLLAKGIRMEKAEDIAGSKDSIAEMVAGVLVTKGKPPIHQWPEEAGDRDAMSDGGSVQATPLAHRPPTPPGATGEAAPKEEGPKGDLSGAEKQLETNPEEGKAEQTRSQLKKARAMVRKAGGGTKEGSSSRHTSRSRSPGK